ncbi:MAG: DUF1851 domain-containing protein [Bacteroidales bacterium]|nr:DUF1851 domain-containing protein [Bacteroidales bacterium]
MFEKPLTDYHKIGEVGEETIQKYQNELPGDWITVWREYGFGSFFDGFFRVINPDEYMDVLKESYYCYEKSIPIIVTAFGDLIVWEEGAAVILHYTTCNTNVLDVDFEIFFYKLEDVKYSIEDFEEEGMPFGLYQKAVKKYGPLSYDECFGYKKPLKEGGKRTVSNIQKTNSKDYMNACIEAFGGVYDEPGPRFKGELPADEPVELDWEDKSGMFEDLNFKLVVIDSLLTKENSFAKKLAVVKAAYGNSSQEIIPEMLQFFTNLTLTQDDLDKVETLDFDGGNDIYFLINPSWDGEADYFEVRSVKGYEKLENLKTVSWTSMCNPEILEEIGVEII